MFVCALRKEGIIICVFCLFILVLFRHNIYENWKNISVALVIGSTLAVLASNVSANYYNVKQASMREALSIPLQQTARYIRDYSEDVSCSEWSVLNSVFQNHAKDLGLYYQPEKSDQVKDLMGYNLTKKQIMAYFEVWFNQFMRHPGCYLSAAFNQFYGYFYIEKEAMYRIGDCRLLNFKSGHPLFTEQIVVVDNPNTKNIRERIINYVLSWPDLPLLGLLYHPAIYTWSLFFGLSCLIYFKKYKYMFLYSIPLIILFICCLSPVNAFIRYSFPIILSSFILTTFSVTIIREQDVT